MSKLSFKDLPSSKVFVAPSILAADFTQLGKDVQAAVDVGVQILHVDVMDGHFVPNLSVGVPVVQSLSKKFSLLFDVHLMLTDPLDYVEAFAAAGASNITFHIESHSPIEKTIDKIKSLGLTAGLTLKPGTPAEAVRPYLEKISILLVMTVEPGFGGQKFMESMLPKIRQIRQWADEVNPALHIEVDGGIAADTAKLVKVAGANVLVAGTSFFRHPQGMAVALQQLV